MDGDGREDLTLAHVRHVQHVVVGRVDLRGLLLQDAVGAVDPVVGEEDDTVDIPGGLDVVDQEGAKPSVEIALEVVFRNPQVPPHQGERNRAGGFPGETAAGAAKADPGGMDMHIDDLHGYRSSNRRATTIP